jgi:cytoskeletal protein CcmA (bactofilin family)
MFSSKKTTFMAKTNETVAPTINLIGVGTSIKGDMNSDGDMRVDGAVNGTVNCKGKLVIGNTGKIEGEISCQNADISGTITGNIVVLELLALKSTANIKGDIETGKLSVEPGASFTGSCSMGGIVKGLKNNSELVAEKTA